jgi:hypothetical protein
MQMDEEPFALALDRDGVEQMRADQRLQRRIARRLIEAPVGLGVKIGTDGGDIDALVAFDVDQRAPFFLVVAALRIIGRRGRRHA